MSLLPALLLTLSAVTWATDAPADVGVAVIRGEGIEGTARFENTDGGLKVSVNVKGVEGEHAFHIHEFGDCSEGGKAAGGHYNPENAPHGLAAKDGKKAHPGDLGNAKALDHRIVFEAVLPRLTLIAGKRSVAGRAIVLHEKADDFSQPAGNAGARLACGVIVLVGK